MLRCSRCKVVFYCSKACQLQAWPSHKHICNATSQTNTSTQTSLGFQSFTQFCNNLSDPEKRKNLRDWFGDYIADNPHLIDSLLSQVDEGLYHERNKNDFKVQLKYADIAYEKATKILSGVKSRGAAEGILMDEATEKTLFPRIFAESFVKVYPGPSRSSTSLATPLDIRAKGAIISEDTLARLFSKHYKWACQSGLHANANADEWALLIREDCKRFDDMRPDLFPLEMRLGGSIRDAAVTTKTHYGKWESLGSKDQVHCRVNVTSQWSWLDAIDMENSGFLANEFPAIHDLVTTKLYSLPFELNRRVPDLKLETPRKFTVSFHVDTIEVFIGPLSYISKDDTVSYISKDDKVIDNQNSNQLKDALVIELFPLLDNDVITSCKAISVENRSIICAHYSTSTLSTMKNSLIDIEASRLIYSIDEKDVVTKVNSRDDKNVASYDNALFIYNCHCILPSQALSLRPLSEKAEGTFTIKLFTIKYLMH
jgi:hypothetical protein